MIYCEVIGSLYEILTQSILTHSGSACFFYSFSKSSLFLGNVNKFKLTEYMLEQSVARNTHDGFCKYTALSLKLIKVFFLRRYVRSLPNRRKLKLRRPDA